VTAISVEHVSKRFPPHVPGDEPVRAVDDVTFRVGSGEIVALLGPSGSGKTTLLRLMAGLERPDTGQVLYDGQNIRDIPEEERGIGMVFQQSALVPHWVSRRSVGFFLAIRSREHELPDRLERIAQITGLGLDTLLERYPTQLSGGEQQRVSIARALARDLSVLLLDAPFANLDAQLRDEARIELKRLLQEFPVTTVYTTHDQTEAMALARRVVLIDGGRLVQMGTYQQLYHLPVDLFVARFVGGQAINIFQGYSLEGKWQGDNFGGYPIRADLEDGTRVTLGIRPENVRLADEGVAGRVVSVVPFYSRRYCQVEVRGGGESWTLNVPIERQVAVGSTVTCALDEARLHYFDPQTGNRIG
jgi:multiple sugar transport system ATP-binding protein